MWAIHPADGPQGRLHLFRGFLELIYQITVNVPRAGASISCMGIATKDVADEIDLIRRAGAEDLAHGADRETGRDDGPGNRQVIHGWIPGRSSVVPGRTSSARNRQSHLEPPGLPISAPITPPEKKKILSRNSRLLFADYLGEETCKRSPTAPRIPSQPANSTPHLPARAPRRRRPTPQDQQP